MTSVSVVIPSYGRPDRLCQTLFALSEHTRAESKIEVIVIHSTVSDDLRLISPIIAALPLNIHLRPTSNTLGAAKARNMGAEIANAGLICFLDADCLVTTGWLRALQRTLLADDRVGAVQATKVDGRTGRRGCGRLIRYGVEQVAQSGFRDLLDTDCILTHKSLLQQIPFDDQFDTGWEDADWSMSIRKRGYLLYGTADSIVIHNHSRSDVSTLYHRERWREEKIRKGTEYFMSKWGFDPANISIQAYTDATGEEPADLGTLCPYRPRSEDLSANQTRLHLNENLAVGSLPFVPVPPQIIPTPVELARYDGARRDTVL